MNKSMRNLFDKFLVQLCRFIQNEIQLLLYTIIFRLYPLIGNLSIGLYLTVRQIIYLVSELLCPK